MSSIAKGSVVQLISGGPQMSVVDVSDYNHSAEKDQAKCVWFDAKNNRVEAVFDIAILKEYAGGDLPPMRNG
ncbi:DUF2158 domain-containing protein [Massilia soli]|nr:DUF2158 domain-containing protein [Massilia soli]